MPGNSSESSTFSIKIEEGKKTSLNRSQSALDFMEELEKNKINLDKNYYARFQTIKYKEKPIQPRAKEVWGIVIPVSTEKRKSPPVLSFEMDNQKLSSKCSWYDVGHLFALQLGGNDDSSNFILQAREMNQHESWAAMEREVRKEARKLLDSEEDKKVTFFGASVNYTSEPKNLYELYIPISIDVFIYITPYDSYLKNANEISSLEKLSVFSKKILGENAEFYNPVKSGKLNDSQIKTSINQITFFNTLQASDVASAIKKLAIMRIASVIQYLQGENLVSLALKKSNKDESSADIQNYTVKIEKSKLMLLDKEENEIDLTALLKNEEVLSPFGGNLVKENLAKTETLEALKKNIEIFLERKQVPPATPETEMRDVIDETTDLPHKKAATEVKESDVPLPSIKDTIESYLHYHALLTDIRPESPENAKKTTEKLLQPLQEKAELSSVSETTLEKYELMHEQLRAANNYLKSRKKIDVESKQDSNKKRSSDTDIDTKKPSKKPKTDHVFTPPPDQMILNAENNNLSGDNLPPVPEFNK